MLAGWIALVDCWMWHRAHMSGHPARRVTAARIQRQLQRSHRSASTPISHTMSPGRCAASQQGRRGDGLPLGPAPLTPVSVAVTVQGWAGLAHMLFPVSKLCAWCGSTLSKRKMAHTPIAAGTTPTCPSHRCACRWTPHAAMRASPTLWALRSASSELGRLCCAHNAGGKRYSLAQQEQYAAGVVCWCVCCTPCSNHWYHPSPITTLSFPQPGLWAASTSPRS